MADGTWAFKRVSLFRKDFDPDMGGPWYTAGRPGCDRAVRCGWGRITVQHSFERVKPMESELAKSPDGQRRPAETKRAHGQM